MLKVWANREKVAPHGALYYIMKKESSCYIPHEAGVIVGIGPK
jgi:hypothetical protein